MRDKYRSKKKGNDFKNREKREGKKYKFEAITGNDSRLIVESNGSSKEFPVSIHESISTRIKEAHKD